MSARILDGKALAAEVRIKVAAEAARLTPLLKRSPGLAVVLVGENPASVVYVRNKARTTVELGMASFEHKLPADTSEKELLAVVAKLTADPRWMEFSCSFHCRSRSIPIACLHAVDPLKDVDGFHPVNAGRLATGPAGARAVHAGRLRDAR